MTGLYSDKLENVNLERTFGHKPIHGQDRATEWDNDGVFVGHCDDLFIIFMDAHLVYEGPLRLDWF